MFAEAFPVFQLLVENIQYVDVIANYFGFNSFIMQKKTEIKALEGYSCRVQREGLQ